MSQVQRDGVAFASTPVALRDAVLQGWRHIVITAHLDLTTLPLRETSICPDGCASPLPDIRGTASIRGNCSAGAGAEVEALAATLEGAPLLPLQTGQCLVLTYEDSLPILVKHMWLDNLYMRMKYDSTAPNPRQYQYATLAGLAPLVGPHRWQAQHYITRTTFQGDGLGPAVGVWADESGYIENCTFANLGGDAFADGCTDCSAAVAAANVSVTIVNSTFLEPSPFPGTAYVRAWADSRIVISGCTFAATPQLLDAPFYVADSSVIYTDAGVGDMRIRSEDDGLEVTPRPLAAVPATPADSTKAILQRSDPWFVNITDELAVTLAPQPAHPAPPAVSSLRQPADATPESAPAAVPLEASDGGPQTVAIIGGAVGAVLLLAAIAACCALWLSRRRKRGGRAGTPSSSMRPTAKEVADMRTTGTASDVSSLPSGKLQRPHGSQGSWRVGSSQGGSTRHRDGPGSARAGMLPHMAARQVAMHMEKPQLPPGAGLPEVLAFVEAQLDSIGPDTTLQEQFQLLGPGERRRGGQSVVAYAVGAFSRQPCIIKFFPIRASYDAELALRNDPALDGLLPQIRAVHDPSKPDDENLAIADRWGRPLPPSIAMPRGESLSEWRQRATPDIFQTASVVAHVADCLREIHAAGYVYGGLKPEHIIHLREQNRWSLVDFDRAVAFGNPPAPAAAVTYAAPEVVAASAEGGAGVRVDASLDAWALGVLAFELLSGESAFDRSAATEEQVVAQLLGRELLPWEGERLSEETRFRLGVFAEPVLGLLQRDPARRPSVQDFCSACQDIVSSNTTTAG